MQYTIMMQKELESFNVYVSSLEKGGEPYTYNTLEEAEAKMAELKAADPTNRDYYISSYPEDLS